MTFVTSPGALLVCYDAIGFKSMTMTDSHSVTTGIVTPQPHQAVMPLDTVPPRRPGREGCLWWCEPCDLPSSSVIATARPPITHTGTLSLHHHCPPPTHTLDTASSPGCGLRVAEPTDPLKFQLRGLQNTFHILIDFQIRHKWELRSREGK